MKAITFKQFIMTMNFRYYRPNCEIEQNSLDTEIIRIKYPVNGEEIDYEWFEFGMYDYASNPYKYQQLEKIFSKEILEMNVCNIAYNQETNTLEVTLTRQKNISEVGD